MFGQLRVVLMLSLFAFAAPVACGIRESPDRVADGFWRAIQAGDLETAQELSTAAGTDPLATLSGERAIQRVELGTALQNETDALVPTSLAHADSEHLVEFNTHLTRFEDEWRVDVRKTRRELNQAALAASIHEIEDSLRESGEALSDALSEGARDAADAIREALENLQQALEGGTPL